MAAMSLAPGIEIVLAYASVLGLVFVGLSAMTILRRRKLSISLGAGDSEQLLRLVRAHANFAEYVPIALLLIGGAAILGAPLWLINAGGAILVAGRLMHAIAILRADGRLRVVGMTATLSVIGMASLFDLIAVAVA